MYPEHRGCCFTHTRIPAAQSLHSTQTPAEDESAALSNLFSYFPSDLTSILSQTPTIPPVFSTTRSTNLPRISWPDSNQSFSTDIQAHAILFLHPSADQGPTSDSTETPVHHTKSIPGFSCGSRRTRDNDVNVY